MQFLSRYDIFDNKPDQYYPSPIVRVMVGKGFSWAGTLPEKRRDCCDTDSDGDIHIGKNCWIGMNTVILKGVTIGYNSIIGAGSVVNSDIPADLLAAGVPAKVVKKYPRGELT